MRSSSQPLHALREHVRRTRTRRRAHARARALTKLVEQRLPLKFEVTGDHDAWPLVAAALLSRMTTTMQSILALQSRNQAVDAGTLLRSLFEHVVHLAWLAADPSPERLEEWRKHDLRSRQTAANDASQRGIELFAPSVRAALDAQVAAMTGNKLVLQNLTEQADAHWDGKLPAMGSATQPQSFRGLYAVLYRNYSGTAHPSFRGLNPVVEDVSPTLRRVVIERPHSGHQPYGLASVIYAIGLYLSSASVGWPDAGEVNRIFTRYPMSV